MRRRRRYAVRYSSLSIVREAIPRTSRLRRYLPVALFLLALSSLTLAMSRPVAVASVPTSQRTIILTIDVSRSMCSTDIEPNRLIAAQAAAKSFIERQEVGTQIGLVAFAGFAEIIHPPTSDQGALRGAVESLTTGRRTAIGSGILKSIDAIAEADGSVAPSTSDESAGVAPTPVPKGAFAPGIIVLLTDGASNAGPRPVEAAQQAVDRGIRVYTIGFGTPRGSNFPNCNPGLVGSEPTMSGIGGGGQFGGGRFRRGIDEDTLKRVATMTDGQYYSAESADELFNAFQDLPTNLIVKHETTEISFVFAAIGALLAGLAISLSLLWHPLP
jgi:Ca-activated chloride channel family protein